MHTRRAAGALRQRRTAGKRPPLRRPGAAPQCARTSSRRPTAAGGEPVAYTGEGAAASAVSTRLPGISTCLMVCTTAEPAPRLYW